MLIRQEMPNDYEEVYIIIKEVFEEAMHTDGNEQDLDIYLQKS